MDTLRYDTRWRHLAAYDGV
jgi:hypothetical protein